jgi:hypothetical protein
MTESAYGPGQQPLSDVARKLGNLPLFMRALPEGEVDEDSALQMEALQSLLYDGDAEGQKVLHPKSHQLALKWV